MRVGCMRSPLLLLIVLVLVARLGHFQRWFGFQEKPMSKKNMNVTLNYFIQAYNNASNDTYLFRVKKLIRSQMQLTTGVEYLLTVKIGRTQCSRNSNYSDSCPFQRKKKLVKNLICDFMIYTVPWMNYFQLWNHTCLVV